MACPYFFEGESERGLAPQCLGPLEPFMPSRIDQVEVCSGSRFKHCAVYRFAAQPILTNISWEVARAIG